MGLFHIHTATGKLFETAINPANVCAVMSPGHTPGNPAPAFNTIIHTVDGKQIVAIEPKKVVMSMMGKSLMDTAGNPGYFHATQVKEGGDEWKIERADYED